MLLGFIKGAGLLLSLCLLQGFNVRWCRNHPFIGKIISGLLFGGISVVGMINAIEIQPGVIFDSRSVILSMAGLFGGMEVALISGTVSAIYRLWYGGEGAYVGIIIILISITAGLIYHVLHLNEKLKISAFNLFGFGLLLHLLISALFYMFPNELSHHIYSSVALPFIGVYSLSTMFLGLVLADTDRRFETEKTLALNAKKTQVILGAIPDLLMIVDEDGTFIDTLSSPEHIHYRDAMRMVNSNLNIELKKEHSNGLLQAIHHALTFRQTITYDYEQDTYLGKRLIEGRVQPFSISENGKQNVLLLARDITDRKLKEDEIRFLAFYDPLTKLPNRRLLQERLHRAQRESEFSKAFCALLFIDIDNFKTLNDTLGHDKGDLLLTEVSRRLSYHLKETDLVARLGGDEFVIMMESLTDSEEIAAAMCRNTAEAVVRVLNEPYQIDSLLHNSSASIGITLFRGLADKPDELMKRADIAMYQAKAGGKNTHRFFDKKMQSAVIHKARLESDLREAIKHSQLALHYQPQVDRHGKTIGAEALLRWPHPEQGMIPPSEFIPLAEECGLILDVGNWVLREACLQVAEWNKNPETAHLVVAVNISVKQTHQPHFVEQVLSAVFSAAIQPYQLKLELTESVLLEDAEEIVEKMSVLESYGISMSLDDFGTGYSSLAYLKRLPLHQLKIDQSFVRDLLTDPNDAAIARTIVALADSMGLDVIAEGVETEEHREKLAELGCFMYQGYLYGKPAPAIELKVQY